MENNPLEMLDVVDNNDHVIGHKTRTEIHQEKLFHRAVHIVITNLRGEILLQKRSLMKDNSPGLWDTSAAGHVDAGESYDQCVVRELVEELGIFLHVVPVKLFSLPASEITGCEFIQVYHLYHEGPFTPAADEIDELRWVNAKELKDWFDQTPETITPCFRLIWEMAVSRI